MLRRLRLERELSDDPSGNNKGSFLGDSGDSYQRLTSRSLLVDVSSSPQTFNIVNVNMITGHYTLRRASNDFTIFDDGFTLSNRDEGDLMAEGYGLTGCDDSRVPRAHQGYLVTYS